MDEHKQHTVHDHSQHERMDHSTHKMDDHLVGIAKLKAKQGNIEQALELSLIALTVGYKNLIPNILA